MNTKRVFTVFLILVLLIAGVLYFIKKNKKYTPSYIPAPTPSIEDQIKQKFNGLTIPDDATKIELTNVSGGEGVGIVTDSGIYADLPELNTGESYQVYVGGETSKTYIGNLMNAKGGWILEFDLSKYQGYSQIMVMKGKALILQGYI